MLLKLMKLTGTMWNRYTPAGRVYSRAELFGAEGNRVRHVLPVLPDDPAGSTDSVGVVRAVYAAAEAIKPKLHELGEAMAVGGAVCHHSPLKGKEIFSLYCLFSVIILYNP